MEMKPKVIGLISDTHGLLRPEAVEVLKGSDLIIHAGDIGDFKVLKALQELAPVVAVRGNVDRGEWAALFGLIEILVFAKLRSIGNPRFKTAQLRSGGIRKSI